ncbi:MAG: 3-dehydroquinate synthase [Deltaproteobacteria bacterium]|nr:3-dehydroquinate synthase [Deltaproteobacteria bacterium]MBI4196282.1 3-dehydroquinate synthase [Deltaproteobacteria bacterium]
MKILKADLRSRRYEVHVGREEVFKKLAFLLRGTSPVLITTAPIAARCLRSLERRLGSGIPFRKILISDGERFKNSKTVESVYRRLLQIGADRKTPLLLLGGGVVGDLGGFVASTYLRGLPYFHLPTTLLAQVDSSIGGKVGIDRPEGKNLIGSFYQPSAVFCNVASLLSLPRRDFLSGMAEVIKYALIRDENFFRFLMAHRDGILERDLSLMEEIVARSIQHKIWVTTRDEREEKGLREILNFGHTFGHALEKETAYRSFRHGEAISIGMVIATKISVRLKLCHPGLVEEVKGVLRSFRLPTESPSFAPSRWLRAIRVDKKSTRGMIHFVFLKGIGRVIVETIAPERLVRFVGEGST